MDIAASSSSESRSHHEVVGRAPDLEAASSDSTSSAMSTEADSAKTQKQEKCLERLKKHPWMEHLRWKWHGRKQDVVVKTRENGKKKWYDTICIPVFATTAVLLTSFLTVTAIWTDIVTDVFPKMLSWLNYNFGWAYTMTAATILLSVVWLFLSHFADLKLGDDDSKPEFSGISWFSMMFSAGIGIGLVFYGVAEPISFLTDPPVLSWTPEKREEMAVPLALFHWCLLGWSVYLLLGMSVAYFSFRMKLPMSIRSCFYPLLGKYIYYWPGHCIDVLSVFGCIFGLATSLGLGAFNVSAGMNYLWNVPDNRTTQLIIITCTTLAAIVSLVTGMDKGIKWLSIINLLLAALMTFFVFCVGPSRYILDAFVENCGNYVEVLIDRTLRVAAYNEHEKQWMMTWTTFYLAWWMSWAPFVGMFIARISKGRTIREFILCTSLVPMVVTAIWFTVYGSTAIYLDKGVANGAISAEVQKNVSISIYVFFEYLPWTQFMCGLAMIVIIVFFVTSSDSGSYVVDLITSGGCTDPPMWQRVFWGSAEGATALILLYAGGQNAFQALQACVVSIALPMCILYIALLVCLIKTFYKDPLMLSTPMPAGLQTPQHAKLKMQTSAQVTDVGTIDGRESTDISLLPVLRNDTKCSSRPADMCRHMITDDKE